MQDTNDETNGHNLHRQLIADAKQAARQRDQQQGATGDPGGTARGNGGDHAQQQSRGQIDLDPQRMHRRQRQHRNGDRRPGHVDGGPQRDGHRIGLFRQAQLLAQLHVDRNVGRRATGEECGHPTLAQTGQHQRIGVALDLDVDDERIDHEGDKQHASQQHHQQVGIAQQRREAGFRQRRSHQAEDPQRRTADDGLDDAGDSMRQLFDQQLGAMAGVAQRQPQGDGPCQDADVVGINQSLDRVADNIEQQGVQHLADPARRRNLAGGAGQLQLGGEHEAGQNPDQGRTEGTKQIEDQQGTDAGLLSLLMAGNRRSHQNKHQNRRNCLQAADEQRAQQPRQLGLGGREPGDQDPQQQADDNLADQTAVID